MKIWILCPHKHLQRGLTAANAKRGFHPVLMLALSVCLLQGSVLAKPFMPDSSSDANEFSTQPVYTDRSRIDPSDSNNPSNAMPVSSGRHKKTHPVVIAPEPILPGTASHVEHPIMSNAQAASVASNIAPDSAVFNNKSLADAELNDPEAIEKLRKATGQDETILPPSGTEPGIQPVSFTPNARFVRTVQDSAVNTALSHYNRGVYYSDRKEWAQAVIEYNQAIQQNILLADAYVGLSTAAIHQRDWENALRNSHQALRLKDNFLDADNITQARYNLSTVYCVADDYVRAARYYEQVVQAGASEAGNLWAFLQSNCHP